MSPKKTRTTVPDSDRNNPAIIYTFRDSHFSPAGDTVVSVAPRDVVVAIFGGGGVWDNGGLVVEFKGAVVFRDDETRKFFLGVWGARKAAKFRNAIKNSGCEIELLKTPPPGRLVLYSTQSHPEARIPK